jgi:CubicO group peptidase (beta-lactamase class C family)
LPGTKRGNRLRDIGLRRLSGNFIPEERATKAVIDLDESFPISDATRIPVTLMKPHDCLLFLLLATNALAQPVLPGIGEAMEKMVAEKEVAGAVTVVLDKEGIRHLEGTGQADVASARAMTGDTLFWIASMSKPVTGVAVLMLQDDGRLNVNDPVAKYLPEFADLKTPSGAAANLTITQILTHTSGLREADTVVAKASTLAELVPHWLSGPTQFEPGSRWLYSQSGINAAARIVEVVSGKNFDVFLEERLFAPLGMKDTGFYPSVEQRQRLATPYAKNGLSGTLELAPARAGYEGTRNRPPQGNGGLYSTPLDYARFCQMLLAGGTFDGRTYLSAEAMGILTTPQSGEIPVGFFQNDTFGQHGMKYGWSLGTCILRTPHEGVAAMLSPGTFGHGGAWGTQAWIDPVKGVAYLLFVQRSNFPNSDASMVRQAFQEAAVKVVE